MTTEAFLRYPEVIRRTGFSRSTLERMVANDTFPAPRQIGERAVAWLDSEVTDWMLNRPQVGYKAGGSRSAQSADKTAESERRRSSAGESDGCV